MKRLLLLLLAVVGIAAPAAAQPRAVVDASAPSDLSVTVYRDPEREVEDEMEAEWPRGFAMISETRTVTLPPGQSTVRFEGVAEGMVAVSAIVTGLPGGTIEKNRNAELLSPAALVNGALGNRVTITRTNPATGVATSEAAIVRTRADGGLVLQTGDGFEAVRCAGLPESLTFDRLPKGLSPRPVFSIDTQDDTGGTYRVTLTYLSWGFDWQANYVATFTGGGSKDWARMNWLSWLSLVNDNGQSFENAQLLVVAGTLNVTSDFEELADPPYAAPLRLTCYPLGSTASGSPVGYDYPAPPPPPAPVAEMYGDAETIVVTGSRMRAAKIADAPQAVMEAAEEALGDLKLYRVPERVTVSAKGMKQVAFLNRDRVEARMLYTGSCEPWEWLDPDLDFQSAGMLLVTKNEDKRGLGVSLPQGMMNVFEIGEYGPQLVAQTQLRDFGRMQDVELDLPSSNQVTLRCGREVEDVDPEDNGRKWIKMLAEVRNANPHEITIRLQLGSPADWDAQLRRGKTLVKNGYSVTEVRIPPNSTQTFTWKIRRIAS